MPIMMDRPILKPIGVIALVVVSVVAAGCENTTDPFSERATFSVYGILDPNQSRNFIRVKPLHAPLGQRRTFESLDAVVTLHNVTTGTSEILEDSVIVFQDGNSRVATHNYWTDTPLQRRAQYRLVIEDQTGETTTATTTVPPKVTGLSDPKNGHCKDYYLIGLPGVKRARRILSVTLFFDMKRIDFEISLDELDHEEVYNASHGRPEYAFISVSPEGMLAEETEHHVDDPRTPQCENVCQNMATDEMIVRFTYGSKEWNGSPPDPITSPLQSRTLTNGSGIFGAIGRGTVTAGVDTTAIPASEPECFPDL